jgi:hypothetical protein
MTQVYRKSLSQKNQLKILKRQNFQCVQCAIHFSNHVHWDFDHIVPLSQVAYFFDADADKIYNWINDSSNFQALCLNCHRTKTISVYEDKQKKTVRNSKIRNIRSAHEFMMDTTSFEPWLTWIHHYLLDNQPAPKKYLAILQKVASVYLLQKNDILVLQQEQMWQQIQHLKQELTAKIIHAHEIPGWMEQEWNIFLQDLQWLIDLNGTRIKMLWSKKIHQEHENQVYDQASASLSL